MTIISEIKEHIAKNKLSDEKVRETWLKAASSDADNEEQNEQAGEEPDGEEDSPEEEADAEEDAAQEQPIDVMRKMMKEMLGEEMASLKRGKKPPKVTKTPKTKPVKQYNYNQEFGEI